MQQVDDFILTSLADACGVERSRVDESTRLTDLGFDSLGAASLIYQLESQYGVQFDQEIVVRMYEAVTVAELRRLLEEFLPS